MNAAPHTAAVAHPRAVLLAVCALALMSTIGMALPYPILAPIFVSGPVDGFTHFGGLPPELLLGLALAANPLGILLGSLVLGPLSDRLGRRAVLLASIAACAAGNLLTAWALARRDYPLFVIARFLTGLTEGNVAVARALLADLHGQIDRTRSFAWLHACLYTGWLLGPVVGGLSLPWGEPVPFLLAAGAMLPCLAVVWLGIPASVSTPSPWAGPATASAAPGVFALLRQDRALARLFGLQLAYTIGVNALYEFAPLWMLKNAGFDSRSIAIATALQCAVMTTASVLTGRAGTPASPLRRSAGMALLAAAGLTSLAVLPGWWGVAMVIALGAPLAVYNAVFPAWVSDRFAAHGQGRIMGLLSTIFCLANVSVAVAGGWLALLDVRWIMALGGLTCVMAASALNRADLQTREAPPAPQRTVAS